MNEPAQPPEKWRYLFDKIDVEFGYRPLATRIDMDHTRLRRLLLGGGTTNEAIQAVADAFKVRPEVIRELRGEQAIAYEPFTLPEDAGRLNQNERAVIRSIVRALLDARAEHNGMEIATKPSAPSEARQAQEDGFDEDDLALPPPEIHHVAETTTTLPDLAESVEDETGLGGGPGVGGDVEEDGPDAAADG